MTDKSNPCLTMGMVQVWSNEKFTAEDADKLLNLPMDASNPDSPPVLTSDNFILDPETGKACVDSRLGKDFAGKTVATLRAPYLGIFGSSCPIKQAKCDAIADAIELEEGPTGFDKFFEKVVDGLISGAGFAITGLLIYRWFNKPTPPGGSSPTGGDKDTPPQNTTPPAPETHALSVEVPLGLAAVVAVKAAPSFIESVGAVLGGLGEGALEFAGGVPFIIVPDGYFDETTPTYYGPRPQPEVY